VSRDTRKFLVDLSIIALFAIACLALMLWLQPKPKLPRATPLITATDLAPEDR